MIKAADLFCGAGGTSIGAHQTGSVDVRFALNHWDRAIETHSANFPNAKHARAMLNQVKPSECDRIGLLFASPECTHHSRARGGRPTTDQQRSGAWEIMPWIEHHRPSFIVVENVVEFEDWGPVGKDGRPLKSMKGKFFQSWIAAIESAGYRVEWRRLNAADFGAATSRVRLFVIARKGNRRINWPEPTHTKSAENMLPSMQLEPWRGAIEIIDWSIPLPSVFGRRKPLADKTLARIQNGLKRHVEPFIVQLRNNMNGKFTDHPIGTITAGGGHHGISFPFIASVNHGDDGKSGKRTYDASDPVGSITTRRGRAVVAPFFVPRHGERNGQQPRSHAGDKPHPTIATSNSASMAVPIVMAPQSGGVPRLAEKPVPPITTMAGSQLIVPWLSSFYGASTNGAPIGMPLPTITTKDRHALTAAGLGEYKVARAQTKAESELKRLMRKLKVKDIGFRMLANEELADAQGFPLDYQFCGTKKDVTKQIGNSVSPPVAKAITEAILS